MNSLDAESIVLKLCLDSVDTCQDVGRYLTPNDFTGNNARLYEAIIRNKEFINVADSVVKGGVKGWDAEKLGLLIDTMALPSSLTPAIKILQTRSTRRHILRLASQIVEEAQKATDIESLTLLAQDIVNAAEGTRERGLRSISDILSDLLADLEKGHKRYIKTGYKELDLYLTGFYNQDLVILAARPSMGKTSFAGNLAIKIAEQGYPVGFFSLEMSDQAIVGRLLSRSSGINSQKIRSGIIYDPEWPKMIHGAERLNRLPFFVDDRGGLNINELHGTAKEWKRKHNGKILFVDYMQLMTAKGRNNNEIVGNISKGLKIIAKDLDIPVVALSQLSRELRNRRDKRPQLSDLRDSGSIEQDADTVLFLHRESYYTDDRKDGATEVIIAKQRNGPLGTVALDFNGATQEFN